MSLYVGVNDSPFKVKQFFVGINGAPKKVVKGYVGDSNNQPKLFWSNYGGYILFEDGQFNLNLLRNNGNSHEYIQSTSDDFSIMSFWHNEWESTDINHHIYSIHGYILGLYNSSHNDYTITNNGKLLVYPNAGIFIPFVESFDNDNKMGFFNTLTLESSSNNSNICLGICQINANPNWEEQRPNYNYESKTTTAGGHISYTIPNNIYFHYVFIVNLGSSQLYVSKLSIK